MMFAVDGNMVWLAWPVVAVLVVILGVWRRAGLWRTVGALVLATYAMWIASVAFFPLFVGDTGEPRYDWEVTWGLINLVPFRSLIDSFRFNPDAYRLARMHGGNFLLLVPYTLLGPMLWPRLRKWWKALVLGLGASVGIELVQLALRALAEPPYRSVDIDDVILNTAGALLGYWLYLVGRAGVGRIRRSGTSAHPDSLVQ